MTKVEWLIGLTRILALAWAMPTETPNYSLIEEGNSYCSIDGTSLECDFRGSNLNASLISVPPSIKNVHVRDVSKLHVKEDICVDLVLLGIPSVTIQESVSQNCGSGLELSAINSTFDRLPRQMTGFYLKSSIIFKFSTDANLTQLAIFNSHIKVLEISSPLRKQVIASFINTTIDYFQKVITEEGSTLTLKNSTVNEVASEGFVAYGGTVNIRNSRIYKVANNSILLYQNVILNMDHYPPILTKGTLLEAKQGSWRSFIIAFIIIIIVVVIIIGIVYALKSKGLLTGFPWFCFKKKSGTSEKSSTPKDAENTSENETLLNSQTEESRKKIYAEERRTDGETEAENEEKSNANCSNEANQTKNSSPSNPPHKASIKAAEKTINSSTGSKNINQKESNVNGDEKNEINNPKNDTPGVDKNSASKAEPHNQEDQGSTENCINVSTGVNTSKNEALLELKQEENNEKGCKKEQRIDEETETANEPENEEKPNVKKLSQSYNANCSNEAKQTKNSSPRIHPHKASIKATEKQKLVQGTGNANPKLNVSPPGLPNEQGKSNENSLKEQESNNDSTLEHIEKGNTRAKSMMFEENRKVIKPKICSNKFGSSSTLATHKQPDQGDYGNCSNDSKDPDNGQHDIEPKTEEELYQVAENKKQAQENGDQIPNTNCSPPDSTDDSTSNENSNEKS